MRNDRLEDEHKPVFNSDEAKMFSQLYRNPDDPLAKSRFNLMCGAMFAVVWNVITANVFLVGFLRENGAADTMIGTINSVILSCGLFQLLTPLILERFLKRKRFLLTMHGIYGFLQLVVLSVLPFLPFSKDIRMLLIAITMVLSAIVQHGFIGSGFSVWHIQCIPDRLRSSYFTYSSIASTAVNIISTVSAGAFLDKLSLQGKEMYAFLILRVIALLCFAIQVFFYNRVVEQPYSAQPQRVRYRSLIITPLKHKPFLLMMIIMMSWCFLANLSGAYYTMYLLNDLNQSYRLITLASSLSTVLVLCSTPVWGYVIRRASWLPSLRAALPLYALFFAGLGFVAHDNIWLYFVCMIGTAAIAPGINLVSMNLPYLHTPQENRTMFVSLFTTGNAVAAFLGVTLGNLLMVFTQSFSFRFLGLNFINKQSMCFLQAALMLVLTLIVGKIRKTVTEYPSEGS